MSQDEEKPAQWYCFVYVPLAHGGYMLTMNCNRSYPMELEPERDMTKEDWRIIRDKAQEMMEGME